MQSLSKDPMLVVRRTFIDIEDPADSPSAGQPRHRSDPLVPAAGPSLLESVPLTQERRVSTATNASNDKDSVASEEFHGGLAPCELFAGRQTQDKVGTQSNDMEAMRARLAEKDREIARLQEALTRKDSALSQDDAASPTSPSRLRCKNTFLEVDIHEEQATGDRFRSASLPEPGAASDGSNPQLTQQVLDRMWAYRPHSLSNISATSSHAAASSQPLAGYDSPVAAAQRLRVTSPTIEEQGHQLISASPDGYPPGLGSGNCGASSNEVSASSSRSAAPVASSEDQAGDAANEAESQVPLTSRTTIMMRNLPLDMSRAVLCELFDREAFGAQYDFVYFPIDFGSNTNFGYAFINLCTHAIALRFWQHFDGFKKWIVASEVGVEITWSTTYQGVEQHVERYRNSPVMHPSMPDESKPIILSNGVRVDFPSPTKSIRPPRIRPSKTRPRCKSEKT